MNISTLFDIKKVVFSLEVFPPKKETSINVIYNTLLKLRGIPCDFISVTYGAGGSETQREKTCEIASLIRTNYHIEPVSHLTCVNSDKGEIRETLAKLKENKIQNILALRGDISPSVLPKKDFLHASDLARFIKEYDSSFNVLGACYPEGHCECSSIEEDIEHLKIKIDSGVTHLITQLFFDNAHFYTYMDKIRKAGINVPIHAGIMPIVNSNQIERMVTMCGASIPNKFSTVLNRYAHKPEALKDAGIFYATEQMMDLLENDVEGIHLYTMNNVEVATRISESIQNIILAKNSMEN
jgi:5,10-methylenetetrahydrofolate reductase, prokaryotic form